MNVLVIAPHMDDEVLGIGGTIIKHVQNGDVVSVVIVADRVYQHKIDKKLIEKERAATLRCKEILGYSRINFLALEDEKLDHGVQDILIPLEKVYDDVMPDIVYTCFYGDNNQDHRAVFQAVRVLVRSAQKKPPSKVFLYETPSSTEQSPSLFDAVFLPNYYVNISDVFQDKLNAVKCYERELKQYPHPRSLRGVESYAQFRGIASGFEYAEALMMLHGEWK